MREVTLWIPGEPRGQSRAKRNGHRSFHDPEQLAYETNMQTEWIAAGRPRLVAGPYAVTIKAYLQTPSGWWLKDGSPSAENRRRPYPTKVPDADNLLKQIDALVKIGCLPDDSAMVAAHVFKFWAVGDNEPGLYVRAWAYGADVADRQAA